MQDLVVAREILPVDVFGVNGNVLYVSNPVAHEGEEGSTAFGHSLLPLVLSKDDVQGVYIHLESLLLFDELIELILPIKHQLVHILVLVHSLWLLIQIEICASPLLDLRVVRFCYYAQDYIAELRDTEVGIGTEQLCEFPLAFRSVRVQRI